MSLKKMSAGRGYEYLTKQTVSGDRELEIHDERRGVGESMTDYYTQTGCPDGYWIGEGRADLGFEGLATESQMKNLFGLGLHPDADRIIAERLNAGDSAVKAVKAAQLGYAFYNYEGKPKRLEGLLAHEKRAERNRLGRALTKAETADVVDRAATKFTEMYRNEAVDVDAVHGGRQPVAGFDLTFSPPKSVSVSWALGDAAVKAKLEEIEKQVVADSISFLEGHAVFSRRGPDGVAHLEAEGLTAAVFQHWDTRRGDPDLHHHVVVSNKVKRADGKWRSLDGGQVYKWTVATSEFSNARRVDLLRDAGFKLRVRSMGEGKEPVIEMAGISDELIQSFSTARAQIKARMEVLERKYKADHGRWPLGEALHKLRDQANLETRPKKADRSTFEALQAGWQKVVPGGRVPVLWEAPAQDGPVVLAAGQVAEAADLITENLSNRRTVWGDSDIFAEVFRWKKEQEQTISPESVAQLTQRVRTVTCIAVVPGTTEIVAGDHRSDGASVYERPNNVRYTSPAVMAAEDRILAAAQEIVMSPITPSALNAALADMSERMAAKGQVFDGDGRRFATAMARTDRVLKVGIGPAGTGKTTAMRVVADAARASGVKVHALAVAATTAQEFGEGLGAESMTIAKWLRGGGALQAQLSAGDFVMVDEAGTVSTPEFDALVQSANEHGAFVVAVGDDRQLGAIGAGGALTMVAREVGAERLTTVHRFQDPEEKMASLRLREGHADWYIDSDRVRGGVEETMRADAIDAWATDRFVHGKNSMIIADLNEDREALNMQAQQWMESHDRLDVNRVCVDLEEGRARAGAGDTIVTRSNAELVLASGGKKRVMNGQSWTVDSVRGDGGLIAVDKSGQKVELSAGYVSQHVQLGYAVTNHVAQGSTVDTAHYVTRATGDVTVAYPAMTRGRESNKVWVAGAESDKVAGRLMREMVARVPETQDAHGTITEGFKNLDKPADMIRATADYAAGLDALRYTICSTNNRLRLSGDGKAEVYQQYRLAEIAGMSPDKLASLVRTDLDDVAAYPSTKQIAEAMKRRVERIAQPDPNRVLANVPDEQIKQMYRQAEADQITADMALSRATEVNQFVARPVTLTTGDTIPSWAERTAGYMTDTTLTNQLMFTEQERKELRTSASQLWDERTRMSEQFRDLNQPGQRLNPEVVELGSKIEDATKRIDAALVEDKKLAGSISDLRGEQALRTRMDAGTSAYERISRRMASDPQNTAQVITERRQAAETMDHAAERSGQAKQLSDQLAYEVQVRNQAPDLSDERRLAWHNPGAGAMDHNLPDDKRSELQGMNDLKNRRIMDAGKSLALDPERPDWTKQLGPVPAEDSPLRNRWELQAGRVEAYRDLSKWNDETKALPDIDTARANVHVYTGVDRELPRLRSDIADLNRRVTAEQQPKDTSLTPQQRTQFNTEFEPKMNTQQPQQAPQFQYSSTDAARRQAEAQRKRDDENRRRQAEAQRQAQQRGRGRRLR